MDEEKREREKGSMKACVRLTFSAGMWYTVGPSWDQLFAPRSGIP